MAKFTAGVGFGQASGSVAGSTYSRNRYGTYIRNKAVPTNPMTTRQQAIRAAFGNLSQQWRGLTSAQRAEYRTQAATITFTDSLGQSYSPSGFGLFMSVNQVRIALGLTVATTPPAQQTQAVITALSATAVGSTGVVTVTFAPAIAASSYYELAATAPMSAGKNYFSASWYKVLGYLQSTDTSPYTATTAYAAVFGGLTSLDSGKKISFRLTPISSNGYRGTPIQATAIIS